MEEALLIKMAKRGDSEALASLLQGNYNFLLKYLIKITMNRAVAEDLTQETMLKAIEKIKLYNGKSKFSSWLITIATHHYIDDIRKKKRERNYLRDEQGLRSIRWMVDNTSEEWPIVLDVLHDLPDTQRLPIILKHYYGYSLEEISKMTKTPIGTVKSRIHNGLHVVRRELNKDDDEPYLRKSSE